MITHTFVILEVSRAAWEEIRTKLAAACYDQAFTENEQFLLIDMHGIALGTPRNWTAAAQGPTEQPRFEYPGVRVHANDSEILLCRRHDFGICGKHKDDCGPDGIECKWVPWPEHSAGAIPWCAVCCGRLAPKSKGKGSGSIAGMAFENVPMSVELPPFQKPALVINDSDNIACDYPGPLEPEMYAGGTLLLTVAAVCLALIAFAVFAFIYSIARGANRLALFAAIAAVVFAVALFLVRLRRKIVK